MAGFQIPDELADSYSWIYTFQKPWMGVIMNAPLVARVDETEDYKAQILDRRIMFSAGFIRRVNNYEEVAGVFLHETFHYVQNHGELLFKWYSQKEITGRLRDGTAVTYPWNEYVAQHALDYSVNDGLYRNGISLPPDRLLDPHIGTWFDAEEDLYVRVYERYEAQGKIKPGVTPGKPDKDDPNPFDVLMVDPNTPENNPGRKAEIVRRELAKLNPAKMRGVGQGDLERLIDRVAPKRFPWTEVIRPRFEHLLGRSKPSWRNLNRPGFALGHILQGKTGTRSGRVLLIIDTSGSVSRIEQECFVHNLIYLMTDCRPKELWLLEIDDGIRRETHIRTPADMRRFVEPMTKGDQRRGLLGGGGTDMCHGWTWMKEKKFSPDLTIVLTDGGTPFPDEMAPSREVIWVITNAIVAPECAGRTARMFVD